MKTLATVVAITALALGADSLPAQSPLASSARGFFIGAHLNGSSIRIEEFSDDTESGGGFGLQLGYGFTRQLGLFIDLTGAALDEQRALAHVDFGLRYAFTGPTRRWVPMIEVALTARGLVEENTELPEGGTAETSLAGGGLTFGAGVQYYVAPKWALGAALKWTGGEFDEYTVDDVTVGNLGIEATSTRFNFGITWFPMGGR